MHKKKSFFFPFKKIDNRTLIHWSISEKIKVKSWRVYCLHKNNREDRQHTIISVTCAHSDFQKGKNWNTLIETLSHRTFLPVAAHLIQEESEHS